MKVCGIELKGSSANLCILIGDKSEWKAVDCSTCKVNVIDDENRDEIISFYETFCNLVRDYDIETIVIKKRNKRGEYAGGAVTFKLEGVLQLVRNVEISFLSAQAISRFTKKNPSALPDKLNKYQETAFNVARTFLGKNS